MRGKSVLISGVGIAGPALAYWLLQHGFVPTLVERSPALRSTGYVIDFWGLGFDIVERMGLLPEILAVGYHLEEVRLVDAHGQRKSGFDADVFRRATHGRYVSLARGDLSAILYRALEGRAEAFYGDCIVALEDRADGVLVRFARGPARSFDMVIGADGLHSGVRALVFGNESQFERRLGYTVAAFQTSGYRPRDANVYVGHSIPGRQVARFSLRADSTMFLFVVADEEPLTFDTRDTAAQKQYLRTRFSGMQWECPQILASLDACTDVYFDRVSQIRMDHWTKGHIALLGDAACAPSLLAGQGAALAIVGAYVLAGELARAANVTQAFVRYESVLRTFMLKKQDSAQRFAHFFAPRTPFDLFLRDQLSRSLNLPHVARLALASNLSDDLELPDYGRLGGL